MEEEIAKGIEAEKKVKELQTLLEEKVLAGKSELLKRIAASIEVSPAVSDALETLAECPKNCII